MATLHLVRHGETTSNVMRRLDTALPGAQLTDFGARQAVRFALERPDVTPAALVCSPAIRAQQTAGLIDSVWGLTPRVIEGVHEVQVGDLEGRADEEAHKCFVSVVNRWYREGVDDDALPGGESLAMLRDRYVPALDELAARYLTGSDAADVYLVSHGAAIRLIAAHLCGVSPEYALTHHLPNLGSIELNYALGQWTCVSWAGDNSPLQPSDACEQVADLMG